MTAINKLKRIPKYKGKVIKAVDMFCGGGGSSTGLIQACEEAGVNLSLIAINHDPTSIETHQSNHITVRHLCQSIQQLDPCEVVEDGVLDLLIATPECIDHSQAKGGRARSSQSRASVNLILDWLSKLYVKHLWIECVEQLRNWGPLGANGKPLKSKKGVLFQEFLRTLRAIGYKVEVRVVNAADYGAPQNRRRLIILASRAKHKPEFPLPGFARKPFTTTGGVQLQPWRTAAEIIDWTLPGKSVFGRAVPLKEATLKRIYSGLGKFSGLNFVSPNSDVLDRCGADDFAELPETIENTRGGVACRPYVVVLRNNCDALALEQPLGTLCAGGRHFALARPEIQPIFSESDFAARLKGKKLALLPPFNFSDSENLPHPLSQFAAAPATAKPLVVALAAEPGPRTFYLPNVGEIEIVGSLEIDYRMLANSELQLASEFPSDYKFAGTKKCVTKQIGNAVPVGLAKAVCRQIVKVL